MGERLVSARLQSQASEGLRLGWAEETPDQAATAPVALPVHAEGEASAFVHIPSLGSGSSRAVVEGTDPSDLDRGPGHYVGTAMPGQSGSFVLAGHRVGRGSSLLEIDELRPGDAVVVETTGHWFVYRVLGDPATGDFTASPTGISGQQIVAPTDIQVISPTPNGPRARTGQRRIPHAHHLPPRVRGAAQLLFVVFPMVDVAAPFAEVTVGR